MSAQKPKWQKLDNGNRWMLLGTEWSVRKVKGRKQWMVHRGEAMVSGRLPWRTAREAKLYATGLYAMGGP